MRWMPARGESSEHRLRARHGLVERAALDEWLDANALDGPNLSGSSTRSAGRGDPRLSRPHCAVSCSSNCAYATISPASPSARGQAEFLGAHGMDHPDTDDTAHPAPWH